MVNRTKIIPMLGFLLFTSLPACQKTEYSYSLSEEQLRAILLDIHASEAMVKTYDINSRDSISKVFYQQILEIHEIEASIFEKDFQMLKRNPKKLEDLYKNVEKDLEEKKEKTFKGTGNLGSEKPKR